VHQPFYKGRTVIEELRGQCKGRTDLRVLSFFGKKDDYIPEAERAHTKMFIKQAVLPYEEVLYPTGHAFFNADRTTYHEQYALQAWEKVQEWWNTKSI
jgi:dienelactone hydrolase